MKRDFRSSVLSGNYDAVLAAIAGFLIIQALCAYGGIGVSPDSVVYISTAQNIHDHGKINDFTNMPVMDFPAFYPIFLCGLIFLTGAKILAFGPFLNGLLFATLIWLCGWIMNRFTGVTRGYKLLLLIFILLSPCLLEVYSMIWSETIFLLLSVLFFIVAYGYFQTHSIRWLLIMAFVAALSCVTRYAGISLAGLGGLLMLCDGRLRWGARKLGHIALYSLLSLSLLILNLYRNLQLTQTLTGYREKGLTPFSVNLHDMGSVFCDWLPFLNLGYRVATVVGVLFILLITGIFLYRLVRRNNFFSYETIALSYFVVYTAFILFSATVSRFQPLDSRLLSPLFLPWLWGSTQWIPAGLKRCPPRWKSVAVAASLAAAVCFIFREVQIFRENWNGIHYAGIPGYTEDDWRKNETMTFVRTHKDSLEKAGHIYSDAFEGLWFLADVRSDLIPHKDNAADIKWMMHEEHFTVVWFDDAVNDDLINIDYIRSQKQLVNELRFRDGAVYFFHTSPPAPPN
ncbi:hypothetical protein [Puia dinghuensis]|uniref:Uncharacterized protein n=1 Tax=Puia dinghuensis TaxID=1792502 RepID=A0A8J2XQM9_9BACT|nr:hypothetical protein [Puia dinghuensis]GGA85695.1 hypothetical protein GCM10011511_05910 [Puia dinghuensis]